MKRVVTTVYVSHLANLHVMGFFLSLVPSWTSCIHIIAGLSITSLIVRCFLWFVFSLMDILYVYPSSLVWHLKRRQTCPPTNNNLLTIPAVTLAEKISTMMLKSEDVVKAYIQRIKETNPLLNGVTEDRFDEALSEAKNIDQMVASSKIHPAELLSAYPLLGVPVTVKGSIAVKGMTHNANMLCNRPKAAKDAHVVKRVKQAGGVILAVTNTPELCMYWETFNKVTGLTRNPYDTRRTAGGSSGGEAALLGSASSLIGVGSDIAGSLRFPPGCCGVWGHKPTPGTVSCDGHFPNSDDTENWNKMFTLGPMARYAADLGILLDVIMEDSKRGDLDFHKQVDLSNINVYYIKHFDRTLTHAVDKNVTRAIKSIAKHFEQNHNASVKMFHSEPLERCFRYSLLNILTINGVDDILEKDEQKSILWELAKYFIGCSKFTFLSILYVALKRFFPRAILKNNQNVMLKNEKELTKIFTENDVLILPTFTSAANFHYQLVSRVYDVSYMSVFNNIGFPVTACPVGLNDEGLPISVQVAAKPNGDRLTLAVAKEIERLFGGWIPPHENSQNNYLGH